MNRTKLLQAIALNLLRSTEIRQAAREFPGLELGAAYRKWKEARGETPLPSLSSNKTDTEKAVAAFTTALRDRPCTRDGCEGTQRLEAICSGCIEGQAGYKTTWTCRTCLHRDLSRESIEEWMHKLSS